MSELYVCWEWPVASPPADLWPLISDTDRFNADSGVPFVEQLGQSEFRRRLRLSRLGVKVEWEEQPFEWLRPERFGVKRRYLSGPLAEMRVLAELSDRKLRYQVWAQPRNWFCRLMVKLQLLDAGKRFSRTLRAYDAVASRKAPDFELPTSVQLEPGGSDRLDRARRELMASGVNEILLSRLCGLITRASDIDVHRIRPYACAREWKAERRDVLVMCLRATRAGMLDLQWELLCPLCRGAKQKSSTLEGLESRVHCEACNIDFQVEFDRSVELTFHPSPAIRQVDLHEYCVGGPQKTPHIVVQQVLDPGARRHLRLTLEPGLYRLRRWGEETARALRAGVPGSPETIMFDGTNGPELQTSTTPTVVMENRTSDPCVMLLERLAWRDDAATAADVTALQIFRDLFSTEALRPDAPLSVGSITVMFTDIIDSTRLYSELGDSLAFGRILQLHNLVASAVEREGGAVVKTIGDRAMAVFRRPVGALRASAQLLRMSPLAIRVALHSGPSIAVTLDDRLDYFGATVNIAEKLAALANGSDIVASKAVLDDVEVESWLAEENVAVENIPGDSIEIMRLAPNLSGRVARTN